MPTLFHLDSVEGTTSIRYGTGLWAPRKARSPLRDPKAAIRDKAIALGFDRLYQSDPPPVSLWLPDQRLQPNRGQG